MKVTAETLRVFGAEPEWSSGKYAALLKEDPNWAIAKAINWYYQNTTPKEIKKYVVEYLKHVKAKKTLIEKIKRVDLQTFRFDSNRTGFLGRMVTRGAVLPEHFEKKLQTGLAELEATGADKAKQAKETAKTLAKMPSVHERMQEQVSDLLAELEAEVDKFIENIKKRTLPREWYSVASFLKINDVKGKQTTMVADHYRRILAEVNEAIAKSDPQLVEGYDYMTRPQLKRFGKFLEKWIEECEGHGATKRKQRKPRKKKVKTPAEHVSKVKYMAKSKEFKIESVDPKTMIGADCIIVFNTRYRFLTIYRAADASGMFVKGTTLQNFSKDKSKERRLRKPKPMLTVASKMGLRAVNSEFKNVRTRDRVPTGRINKHCVILRVL